ncbi:MAG: 30S ribosomal protein S2 [Candidatus Marinimicrobia bacterium]|nr:30S ribosomal protein S2 [Candidatus Neomarinimicrobiota bacterium]
MAEVTFEDLLRTGAHFGHVKSKWNPAFERYTLMVKNGVHIINLDETLKNLDKAFQFVRKVVKQNGEFLFVGTKKQARDIVQQEADRCGMFYVVERWLGGTLTNFSTIKKSIKRLQLLEKEGSRIYENLTKKEVQMLNRERIKLADQHRGIKDMKRLPDAIIVVDANFELTAVKEAKLLEIPVVAIVDTNTDPNTVDYPIPANDDSIRTIQLIIAAISDEILQAIGKEKEEQVAEKMEEAKEQQKEKIVVKAVEVKTEKADTTKKIEEVKATEKPKKESSEKVKETTAEAAGEKAGKLTEGKEEK